MRTWSAHAEYDQYCADEMLVSTGDYDQYCTDYLSSSLTGLLLPLAIQSHDYRLPVMCRNKRAPMCLQALGSQLLEFASKCRDIVSDQSLLSELEKPFLHSLRCRRCGLNFISSPLLQSRNIYASGSANRGMYV